MILDIEFKQDEIDFIEMQNLFNSLGQRALFMSHYDLAEETEIAPIFWKQFLMDPRVAAVLAEEMQMLERTKASIMLNTIDTNKNTGQAQLLNTLLNRSKEGNKKEGPVFIYTQVPLNSEEINAPNTVVINESNSN